MSITLQNNSAIKRNVASPYTLAIISYILFLFACSFSPKIYSSYMSEPDFMFMDLKLIIFYSLCVFFFISGVAYIDILSPKNDSIHCIMKRKISSLKFISMPVIIALIFCIASCCILIKEYPLLLLAIISQMGGAIKESEIGLHAPLGLANTWLMGILWWAIWRVNEIEVKRYAHNVIRLLIIMGIISCALSAVLKASRGELMPLIFGTGIIILAIKASRKSLTIKSVILYGVALVICSGAIFLLFSFIRGNTATLSGDLISYTIASYNRLSALIHHKFTFPYAGRGLYLFSFLQSNNMLNAVIPFRDILGWPDFVTYWQSEFWAVASSGLNRNLIWSSTFGYIYSELGWFAPLYVFIYGLLYGYIWKLFKRGNTFGIILYPWFGFCVLFWFGTNYLFDNKFVVLLLDAMIIYIYERMIGKGFYRSKQLIMAPKIII